MIKSAYFPNKTFTTKQELFKELKDNRKALIDLKKATILNSDGLTSKTIKLEQNAVKGLVMDSDYSYHIINTTKYLDSHNDVHMDGIWNKSINEQQGKVYFLADHDMSIKSIIAHPKDVEMSIQDIEWKSLGRDYSGSTQALMFKVKKDAIVMPEALSIIENKINIEHSIRMQYVKIDLAINDESKDYAEEKAVWDGDIENIANKERALEEGYFWRVSEAKIAQEGSMVLRGSNDATPILEQKEVISTPVEVKEVKKDIFYHYVV